MVWGGAHDGYVTRRRLPAAMAIAGVAVGVAAVVAAALGSTDQVAVPKTDGGILVATDRPLPAVKAALEAQAEEAQAAAAAKFTGAKKPSPASPAPAPRTERPPSTGIVEVPPPFPSMMYRLSSTGWAEVTAGRRTGVYVGAEADDPSQGVVIVSTAELPSGVPRFQVFRTPAETGAVEIAGVAGDVLALTAGAATLHFDVSARSFAAGSPSR